MNDDLKKDQCGVCGDYCVSHPTPWPWKQLATANGKIQACSTCFERYYGMGVQDPRKHYVQRRLENRLARLEAEASEVEDELESLE